MTLQTITKEQTIDPESDMSEEINLNLKEYHVFSNVILKTDSGWARVDYIVVSKYGVFIVETKSRNGRINRNGEETQWTEVLNNNELSLQSPVKQTYLNTKGLADFLNIDHELVHPVIIFGENYRYRKIMPDNILTNICAQHIRRETQRLLDEQEVERICRELNQLKANLALLDAWRQLKAMKKRYRHKEAVSKSRRTLT